ncbi:MAG: family 16 glycoside hydrolase [Phycisphaerales bacterium]
MHRPAIALSLSALAFSLTSHADPPATPIRLFDGASLSGWSGDPRFWSVEDGVIVGRSTEQTPCERNTYLIRDGAFDDFELRLEFAIDGGNSGIQYRSRDLGDFAVAGYQADLEAGPNYTGILYEEKGRGIVAWRGERVALGADGSKTASPDLGDRAALQSAIRPGWNEYVIRAVGPRLSHTINGVPLVEVTDRSPEAARSGQIALQLHAGPPMTVRYRNLVLTPIANAEPNEGADTLPSAPPLRADDVAWIWGRNPATDGDRFFFRTSFSLDEPATLANLVATCDNRYTLWLDGQQLLSGKAWDRPQLKADSIALAPGRHEILVRAENEGGPAGLLVRGTLRFEDGREQLLRTDETWECAPAVVLSEDPPQFAEPSGWRSVHSFGPSRAPNGPWPDPFAPRDATPAESISVPPGYRVELVHASQFGEGSWIAMGFDEHGDLLVSKERGHLARVVMPQREGDPVRLIEITESPVGSMGFVTALGSLFVQGSGPQGYGLYRMTDRDGDRAYEDVTLITKLGDGGEHGSHAVRLGPDGLLYLMNGNHCDPPADPAPTSPHQRWAEDVLEPRVEDPRGHAVGVRAPGGQLMRLDPDGGPIEIVAAGFRNAYDFDFGPEGEVLTFDSDMEWDLGLPWYRPTRVYHVVSGGEYGWRSGSAKWRDGVPDMAPTLVDVGMSSPVGVLYGEPLAFPLEDRAAFYIGDWSYGRILRVRLDPDGGTFGGSFDHFLTGKPLQVTDLEVGPDGAMWFITGGRGTQSGLYRVTHEDAASLDATPLPPMVGEASRAKRRAIESLHGDPSAAAESLDSIWIDLADRDGSIAYAARVALEFAPVDAWRSRAVAEADSARALAALLALVRTGETSDVAAAIERLGAFEWATLDRSQRQAWLRLHEIALARHPELADEAMKTLLRSRLEPVHPCGDVELDRAMLAMLVVADSADAVKPAIKALGSLEVAPALDVAMSLRLSNHLDAADREALFRWLASAKNTDGGHSFRGYLDAIERDALARAPESDRESLAALAAPAPRQVPDLAAVSGGTRIWSMQALDPYLPLASKGRDFDAGRAAYLQAACASCHRFDGSGGGGVGPDLTSAGSRFSRRDLLRTILEPSADISDQYRNTRVRLRNGRIVIGRIVRDDDVVELIVDPYTGQTTKVAAKDIVAREASPVSPMPMGLLSTLELEQILDLVAYIESGGNPNHPAFTK